MVDSCVPTTFCRGSVCPHLPLPVPQRPPRPRTSGSELWTAPPPHPRRQPPPPDAAQPVHTDRFTDRSLSTVKKKTVNHFSKASHPLPNPPPPSWRSVPLAENAQNQWNSAKTQKFLPLGGRYWASITGVFNSGPRGGGREESKASSRKNRPASPQRGGVGCTFSNFMLQPPPVPGGALPNFFFKKIAWMCHAWTDTHGRGGQQHTASQERD